MTDPLELIWGSFDTPDPMFDAETVEWFPQGVFDRLVAMGLVVRAENTNFVTCPSCSDHVEEVLLLPGNRGQPGRFVIPCPDAGCVTIPPELMLQWRPDFRSLARLVKDALRIDPWLRVTERISNRLWRLGTVEWKKTSREVFLARGLNWPEGEQVAEQCPAGSIVLIGSVPPPRGIWPLHMPAVVPLPSVIGVGEDGAMRLDASLFMSMVAQADTAAQFTVTAAVAELEKHAARIVERRVTEGPTTELIAVGVSQGLSVRGIEQDLADRGVSMDHSTIARKIQKVKAGHRGGSSPAVIKRASSQPRDRYGKLIRDAQPEEDE